MCSSTEVHVLRYAFYDQLRIRMRLYGHQLSDCVLPLTDCASVCAFVLSLGPRAFGWGDFQHVYITECQTQKLCVPFANHLICCTRIVVEVLCVI